MANDDSKAIEKPKTIDEVTDEIELMLSNFSIEQIKDLSPMKQSLALARGLHQLRNLLNQKVTEALLIPLQNSRLGFRTDKEDGYEWRIVRDACAEAMIRGFNVTGNEMNIIAKNAYFTKEGFERKVEEFRGFTAKEIRYAVPVNSSEKTALVAVHAKWMLDNKPQSLVCDIIPHPDPKLAAEGLKLDLRIPVRVNAGMGADGVIGKAARKIHAQIYTLLIGRVLAPPDGDAIETTAEVIPEKKGTEAAVDNLVNKHREKTKNGNPTHVAQKATGDYDIETGEMRDPGQEG